MTDEIACVIEPAGGILGPPGYATSVAVTDSRWYLREAYGVSHGGHDVVGRRGERNLEREPGFTRTGDGQHSITCIGASADGFRVLAGWKQDNHGTVILRNRWSGNHSGRDYEILGEFGPARTLGGVACVRKGDRYYGYSLSGFALTECDVTAPASKRPGERQFSSVVSGAPGGTGLCAAGDTVAYLTTAGDLVTYTPGGAPCITPDRATCLSMEGGRVLVGVHDGMDLLGAGTTPLPATPHAVCLLGGVSYAWVTGTDHVQRLYREDAEVFEMPSGIGTVVDCKGIAGRLYCATTDRLVVVRVS